MAETTAGRGFPVGQMACGSGRIRHLQTLFNELFRLTIIQYEETMHVVLAAWIRRTVEPSTVKYCRKNHEKEKKKWLFKKKKNP